MTLGSSRSAEGQLSASQLTYVFHNPITASLKIFRPDQLFLADHIVVPAQEIAGPANWTYPVLIPPQGWVCVLSRSWSNSIHIDQASLMSFVLCHYQEFLARRQPFTCCSSQRTVFLNCQRVLAPFYLFVVCFFPSIKSVTLSQLTSGTLSSLLVPPGSYVPI